VRISRERVSGQPQGFKAQSDGNWESKIDLDYFSPGRFFASIGNVFDDRRITGPRSQVGVRGGDVTVIAAKPITPRRDQTQRAH
jgi:hypothetical protein